MGCENSKEDDVVVMGSSGYKHDQASSSVQSSPRLRMYDVSAPTSPRTEDQQQKPVINSQSSSRVITVTPPPQPGASTSGGTIPGREIPVDLAQVRASITQTSVADSDIDRSSEGTEPHPIEEPGRKSIGTPHNGLRLLGSVSSPRQLGGFSPHLSPMQTPRSPGSPHSPGYRNSPYAGCAGLVNGQLSADFSLSLRSSHLQPSPNNASIRSVIGSPAAPMSLLGKNGYHNYDFSPDHDLHTADFDPSFVIDTQSQLEIERLAAELDEYMVKDDCGVFCDEPPPLWWMELFFRAYNHRALAASQFEQDLSQDDLSKLPSPDLVARVEKWRRGEGY